MAFSRRTARFGMTTKADLSGSRRKLARGKKDLEVLHDKISTYMKSSPYRFIEQTKGNSYSVISLIDRAPDPEWEIDFAQIAEQARSALDLLVYQLVIDNTGADPINKTQFPIFRDSNSYFNAKKGKISPRDSMLAGVSSRHRSIIDNFQPYQRGRMAANDPLMLLTLASNRDKHRLIHVGLVAIAGSRFKLHMPDGRVIWITISNSQSPNRIMNNGKVLGVDNFPPPNAPHQKVKMEVQEVDVQMFFEGDDGLFSTIDGLNRSVARVLEIINTFSPILKP
jgi:hypothetical protein